MRTGELRPYGTITVRTGELPSYGTITVRIGELPSYGTITVRIGELPSGIRWSEEASGGGAAHAACRAGK